MAAIIAVNRTGNYLSKDLIINAIMGNIMKRLLTLLLLLASLPAVFAQYGGKTIIKIDPATRASSDIAPFDADFYVFFPVDSSFTLENIRQVDLYKITGKRKKETIIKSFSRRQRKDTISAANKRYRSGNVFSLGCNKFIIQSVVKSRHASINGEVIDYCLSLKGDDGKVVDYVHTVNLANFNYLPSSVSPDQVEDRCSIVPDQTIRGYKYLAVHVKEPLAPNVRFSIRVVYSLDKSTSAKLMKINAKIRTNDLSASSDYLDLVKEQVDKKSITPQDMNRWQPFSKCDTNKVYSPLSKIGYEDFYKTALLNEYDGIYYTNKTLAGLLLNLSTCLQQDSITSEKISQCNCEHTLVAKEVVSSLSDLSTPLFNLVNLRDSIQQFADGLLNIQDQGVYNSGSLGMADIDIRIGNLQKLKTSILVITRYVTQTSIASSLQNVDREYLYRLSLSAEINIDLTIKSLKKYQNNVQLKLAGNNELFGSMMGFGVNAPRTQDLKVASGNYLIPDVGLVNIGTIVNGKFHYVIRPYWGVNISFRAINKQVSFKDLPDYNLWRHLSLSLGLTASPLTGEGTSDLFKNMSLLGGIGYRCNKWLRVTPGVLLYKSDNVNPILPQKYTVAPTLSLSFDLDVVSWFSQLSGKVF